MVVASRQRAAALRLEYARRKLDAGLMAWTSADIIPWDAWLVRCADDRAAAQPRLRRLSSAGEWLLWREAAQQACGALDMLAPGRLGDSLRRSVALTRDWGMRWTGEPTQEAAVLQRAQRIFAERCRDLMAWPASDWERSLGHARAPAAPLIMAGFDAIGPRLASRLRELGATIVAPEVVGEPRADEVVACGDATDELRRAARWCRERLQRDPGARLLVVDLVLERRRPLAVQCFEHELLGGSLGEGDLESPFAIEGGQELASHATVGAALGLLRLACGRLEFPELSALLRSPYLRLGGGAFRAALELRLRDRNIARADCASLLRLARTGRFNDHPAAAEDLSSLATIASEMALERGPASRWGPRFASVLEAGGWPGDGPLSSAEQQQCERWRELLGEFSLLEAGGDRLGPAQALELLDALATRTAFDAATGDVAVTVTASTLDPLIGYDGIWVAGLSSESWPLPPRADPFVPLAAQHAAGFPPASPRGQLQQARRAMSNWQRCARALVYSWPRSEGEVPQQASGLLAPRPAQLAEVGHAAAIPDGLVTAIRGCEQRELRPQESARPWPAGLALVGGTRILELQSECPFHAAAELRLGAVAMSEPIPGLDHRERGLLLHRALELAWRELGDSTALRRLAAPGAALETLARECGAQALRERLARRELPLPAALAENEARRLATLVAAALRRELERAPAPGWRAARLEEAGIAQFGGQSLRVRMDRVDELEDGRLLVIDYKSGAPKAFRPLDERPRQAQLLAYALFAGETVAGVAAVHVTADDIAWRGAVDDPSLLPALGRARAPTAPWPQLRAHWRQVVERLLRDFASGRADVDPLRHACESCPLPALCRIGAERILELEDDEPVAGSLEGTGGG